MIELVIVSSLLGLMILAVSTLAISGGDAQEYARRLNRATEITQDLIDEMRLELVSSVRLFGNDTEGLANLGVFDLAGAPVPIDSQRLPTIDVDETLRVDTSGDEITGNSLFFTRLAWNDRFECTSGGDYLIDVYRWVHYYLTEEEGGPTPGNPIGLNIVRVFSEPLVDAASLDRISDPSDLGEVLEHLHEATPDANGITHSPCDLVWVRGALPSVLGTIRQIDASTWTLSDTPVDGRDDPFEVERSEAVATGLLSYRHHSVATNHARSSFGVGRYGLIDNDNDGFPHGFEVQMVGTSAARQVLLHLVVASTHRRGQWAWSDLQVVVDTRDL